MDALDLFVNERIVPVVVLDEANIAVDLAQTLLDAGIGAMEITLRTSCALAAIEAVAEAVPGMLVGAGSVRKVSQVHDAATAGAQFLVCPGSSTALLAAVDEAALPFVPGAVTATEMLNLVAAGYQLMKFFPAELSGGVAKLKAISEPLSELRFFPTGGITPALATDYLALPSVACIGGSWFVPRQLIAAGDLNSIGELSAAAVALARGVDLGVARDVTQ